MGVGSWARYLVGFALAILVLIDFFFGKVSDLSLMFAVIYIILAVLFIVKVVLTG